VHTNLGRSLLAREAIENVAVIAGRYSNLEYNLKAGKRGSRYSHVEELVCEICGVEAAVVVNNNAGAVLLCLETLARNKAVVVSRGELVEIGGSFRVPDVMSKSGAILREVGTTNRTHPDDYENALEENTALLLKVHRSNFSVVGFTAEVGLQELVKLGAKHHIPVMEDLGSGTFVDFSKYGLQKEPTVQDSVKTGVDVISFSGDKLLGGPQAGLIVGKKHIIERIKKNPLTRALRIDKMTLAALESTLRFYPQEEGAISKIPTLRMITEPVARVAQRANLLRQRLQAIGNSRLQHERIDLASKAGGGALPLLELPSCGVSLRIEGVSTNTLEKRLRAYDPPIIVRIEGDSIILDLRTMQENEIPTIISAFQTILQ
jgi:L-seryl-tRNA(Ser) seleniumtransferase